LSIQLRNENDSKKEKLNFDMKIEFVCAVTPE